LLATPAFRSSLKDAFSVETSDEHVSQWIGKNPVADRVVTSIGIGWKFQSDRPGDIDCLDACPVNGSDASGDQVSFAGLDLVREEF
jgi:hypothetical protein